MYFTDADYPKGNNNKHYFVVTSNFFLSVSISSIVTASSKLMDTDSNNVKVMMGGMVYMLFKR